MRLKPRQVVIAAAYLLGGGFAAMGAMALTYHADWNSTAVFYLLMVLSIGVGALLQNTRDLS